MIREFIIFPLSLAFCLLFIADHNAFYNASTDALGFFGTIEFVLNFIWEIIVCVGLAVLAVIVSIVFRLVAYAISVVVSAIRTLGEIIDFQEINDSICALLRILTSLLKFLFTVLHIIFLRVLPMVFIPFLAFRLWPLYMLLILMLPAVIYGIVEVVLIWMARDYSLGLAVFHFSVVYLPFFHPDDAIVPQTVFGHGAELWPGYNYADYRKIPIFKPEYDFVLALMMLALETLMIGLVMLCMFVYAQGLCLVIDQLFRVWRNMRSRRRRRDMLNTLTTL